MTKKHPFHYSEDKNIVQKLIDFLVPIGLFFLYYKFYNAGLVTPSEMVKTTGLLSIALLSITLVIGPLCRFFPALDFLKAHRKFWGVLSFLVAVAHVGLIYIYFVNFNILKLFNPSSPKYLGIIVGLVALIILLIITLTSNQKVLNFLSPKTWKVIQSAVYLALAFAFIHFYLIESTNGVLVIKRLLGQITFYFAAAVVTLRFIILFFPSKKQK